MPTASGFSRANPMQGRAAPPSRLEVFSLAPFFITRWILSFLFCAPLCIVGVTCSLPASKPNFEKCNWQKCNYQRNFARTKAAWARRTPVEFRQAKWFFCVSSSPEILAHTSGDKKPRGRCNRGHRAVPTFSCGGREKPLFSTPRALRGATST